MFGLGFPWLKIGAIVAVVAVIGFGYWHYTSLLRERDQLRVQTAQQQVALENWADRWNEMKVALEKSVKTHKEARKVYVEMEALFDRHDLAALAQAKPGLIELRVNRATAADGRLFECITDPDCTPTSGQPSSD